MENSVYLVINNYGQLEFNNQFLVRAKNKKDAIEKVYSQFGDEFSKRDFKAYLVNKEFQHSDTKQLINLSDYI